MLRFFVLFISIVLGSFTTYAQLSGKGLSRLSSVSGMLVRFDDMTRDFQKGTITLEGNVELVFNEHYLSCNKAIIYTETKNLACRDGVVLQTQTAYAEAQSLEINYETNIGTLHKGFVQSGQVVFEGEVIRKTGPKEYEAENGSYTACATCPPAWSFTGKEIKATLGETAKIYHPIVRFGNVPVFWLPYLALPLQSQRQTGLLVPSFDFSNSGGTAFTQKFFWAISPHQDSTWGMKWYEKRGLKTLFNYRYVLSEDSRGELDFSHIADRVFSQSARLNNYRSPQQKDKILDRWFLKYSHQYRLPYSLVQKMRLHLVSDLQYPRDFPEDLEGHGDSSLENRVSLTQNTENQHASAEAAIYVNLLKENPIDNNREAVHRFPHLRYSLSDISIAPVPLYFSFDLDYINFIRNSFSYDEMEQVTIDGEVSREVTQNRDGDFGSDDLMRTGQRLRMNPQWTYPIHWKNFDFLPVVGWESSFYQFAIDEDNSAGMDKNHQRHLLRTSLAARTSFSRVFGPSSDKATAYKHQIQPQITFSAIPWLGQQDHPFFGDISENNFSSSQPVTDQDLNGSTGIQFDYFDRIYRRKQVTLSLTNYLIQKRWLQDVPSFRRLLTFELSQTYDLYEADKGGAFPLSELRALLDMRLDNFETNTILKYYPYHEVVNSSSRIKVNNRFGHFFQVGYTQEFRIDTEGSSAEINFDERTENVKLSGGWSQPYFSFTGEVDFNLNPADPTKNHELQAWSYTLLTTPPGNCWGLKLTLQQVASGDTIRYVDFIYNFDGQSFRQL